MVKIIWSESAKEDLREIKSYIAKDSPEYAIIFAEKVFEKIRFLESFPKMVGWYLNQMILTIEN